MYPWRLVAIQRKSRLFKKIGALGAIRTPDPQIRSLRTGGATGRLVVA
jgi:hypothetical protein